MRRAWLVVLLLASGGVAAPLGAQEFHPPPVQRSSDRGTRLGLFGSGVRGGVDVSGRRQLVFGVTLDAGHLFGSRFRIRPSGETGVFNGANRYIGSLAGLSRFTGHAQPATPDAG